MRGFGYGGGMIAKCPVPYRTLRKRSEFLALSKGETAHFKGFVIQFAPNAEGMAVGYTASKKVGGAVQRNRAKRRLRAVVDKLIRLNSNFNGGLTLNLIARTHTLDLPFEQLEQNLREFLESQKCTL